MDAKKLVLFGLVLLLLACFEPAGEARLAPAKTYSFEQQFAGQTVMVEVEGLSVAQADLSLYVKDAVLAVSKIYGKLPVKRTVIKVEGTDGDSVGFATSTYDDDEDCGLVEIAIGRYTSRATLARSWTLTHELLHLGFPIVERSKRWLAEGIATYEEPIGRLRIGLLRPEEVWADLVRYGPSGLPTAQDGGLNDSHLSGNNSWGRTYWGGALYCLLCDIEIRQKTANKYGLEHALRGIAGSGGTARSNWSATEALAAGDRSLGLEVLSSRYKKMAFTPSSVDLTLLWQQLGIKRTPLGIVFDNNAPMARIRQAIEAGD